MQAMFRQRRTGWVAALVAAAILAPALSACESVFAAQAERDHPVPGKLVEVADGRRIQIDCRGEGSPTIVFQSGGDLMGALAWTPVMEKAAAKSRACAYSRAGILWSDPARGAFRPEEVAEDLHAALKSAGEAAPYLLVSHSRGLRSPSWSTSTSICRSGGPAWLAPMAPANRR